jgi:hypothetical protein
MILDEVGHDVLSGLPDTFVGSIVTGIALAVGDDDLRYFGANAQSNGGVVGVRVGAFTDDTLVTVEAAFSAQSGGTDVTTRVHRRSDLQRLDITGGTPSTSPDGIADWPGRFTIRAVYNDGLEVIIPMSEANTPHKRNSVWTILSGLRHDLSVR